MPAALFVLLSLPILGLCHQNQQPYQPPAQPAYQQQVPQHPPQQQAAYQQQQPPQQAAYQQQQAAYQQQPQQAAHQQQGGHQHQGGHRHQGGHQHQSGQPNMLRDKAHVQDLEHIKEHLQGVVNTPDVSKMTEEELQFHYFKMHDNDDNNKLDGCELIKSVLHWHVEESKSMGANAPQTGTTKIFQDAELSLMIDPILDMDDRNADGFIDYPEFVAAQKSRGL